MTTTPDTLAKLAAKAAHEAVSAIYFADSSDYLPALRSITRLLAPDLAAMLDTDEQLAWQTSDDRANGPDEIAAQALPAAEPVYQYQKADGSWIDQQKSSYDYNVKYGVSTVRVLYTTPQAAQQAAQATAGWVMPDQLIADMTQAADLIEQSANSLRDGHTVCGRWVSLTPIDVEAKAAYEDESALAQRLRAALPQPQPQSAQSKGDAA